MFTPYWLTEIIFRGSENDESGTGTANGSTEETSAGEATGSSEETATDSAKDLSGLQSALAAERQARRKAEKDLAKLTEAEARAKQTEAEALAQLKKDLDASVERSTRLASGFLEVKLEQAILEAAKEAKFKDPSDALAMIDRSLIVAEQDEDDPSKVTIEKATVKAAVKKLADAKKHLLSTGTEDGGRTGSQFGGTGSSGKPGEQDYKNKYPSL